MNIAVKLAIWVATYLACWLVAHMGVFVLSGDGLGIEYLFSYFVMAWSFNAGELPSFIWLFSLVLFAIVVAFWFLIRPRSGHAQPTVPADAASPRHLT